VLRDGALEASKTRMLLGAPAVWCIVMLGLGLRVWGVAFGLPYVFHPDEPRHVVEAVRLMMGATDALSFENPGLYRYLLVGVYAIVVGRDRLAEVDATGQLYLVARVVSAVAGALTVLAVYWLGQLVRGHRAGLLAGTLAAVSLLLVRESHFAVNDALGALASTVALGACALVARCGRRRDYLLAGATLGLAFAAKYQAAIVAVPLLIAHVQHGRRRRDGLLVLSLVVAGLAAVMAFPPLVTETRRVLIDTWVNIVLPSRLGWEGLDRTPGFGYFYYLEVLNWGTGWPILLLAGVAAVRAVRRRDWLLIVVASLPVVMFAALGGSHIFFARYLLPAVPALVVLAAVAIDDAAKRTAVVGAVLAAVALAGTLPNTLAFDTLLTRTDTRTAARAWVQANVPPGQPVLAEREAEGPPLEGLSQTIVHPDGQFLFDTALDTYRQDGITYIVTSSYTSEAPNIDADRNARRVRFYAALDATAEKLVEFRPYRGPEPGFVYDRLFGPLDALDQFQQPGPTITIYRISGQS
jgi:dolichyl-phosphate-mannose-protein mannosyltransferase